MVVVVEVGCIGVAGGVGVGGSITGLGGKVTSSTSACTTIFVTALPAPTPVVVVVVVVIAATSSSSADGASSSMLIDSARDPAVD